MALLVEALFARPKFAGSTPGRGVIRPQYDTGVDSYSNRNEYQGYLLGGKGGRRLGRQPKYLHVLLAQKFWQPQTPGAQRECPGLEQDMFHSKRRIDYSKSVMCVDVCLLFMCVYLYLGVLGLSEPSSDSPYRTVEKAESRRIWDTFRYSAIEGP